VGLLHWRICVRDFVQRLLGGFLPTLIDWGGVHPTDHMAASGVALQSLTLAHPEAARLHIWSHQVGMAQMSFGLAPVRLTATFQTPKGLVVLGGPG
jgi:hypothetical protein